MASKYDSPIKGARYTGGTVDFRAGTVTVQDEPWIFFCQKVRKVSKESRDVKGHGKQLRGLNLGQHEGRVKGNLGRS